MGGRVYGDEEEGLKMGSACGCGLVGKRVESMGVISEGGEAEREEVEVGGRVWEKQQLALSMAVTKW